MGMKVCKLVRLTSKDEKGNFTKDKEGNITVRARAIVDESSVKETEENYKYTGLLYIVDEKATAAREKELEAEAKEPTAPIAPATL